MYLHIAYSHKQYGTKATATYVLKYVSIILQIYVPRLIQIFNNLEGHICDEMTIRKFKYDWSHFYEEGLHKGGFNFFYIKRVYA
jgi:hypothetical protein